MNEAQTSKRHLGKNMKARTPNEIKEIDGDDAETDVSATVVDGQFSEVVDSKENDEPAIQDRIPDPPDTKLDPETEQNPVVAENGEEYPPRTPYPILDDATLRDLMEKSKEPNNVVEMPAGTIVMPTAEEIHAITGEEALTTPDFLTPLGTDNTVTYGPPLGGKTFSHGIGRQASGDYGIVVTVPEQLVAGVLSQAELDGVTPEEWLTVRMGEYLEQWFHGK